MDAVAIVTFALVAGALIWVLRGQATSGVVEDRPEQRYDVFTEAYDIECLGREVEAVLEEHAVNREAPRDVQFSSLEDRLAEANLSRANAAGDLASAPHINLDGWSLLVLLDQSGSMAKAMPDVAGRLSALVSHLEGSGANVALAGFTTVGWHGGQSRLHWQRLGKPQHPGRLCDLLYVKHREFGSAEAELDLGPMVRPNVLFENVDGEALLWAREYLLTEPSKQHALIIVSDGAPVDDSTIVANGHEFLWRHLKQVVVEIEADDKLSLAGVGLDYRVDSLYRISRHVSSTEALNDALLDVILAIVRDG